MNKIGNSVNMKEFYAPVSLIETDSLFKGAETTLGYNDHCVVVHSPSQGDIIVNFCSEGYGLIPTEDLFPPLEKELKKHCKFDATYQVLNHGRFYVEYNLKGMEYKIGKKDAMSPILRIQHSYNSQIGYRVEFGFYRLICENGMWGIKFEAAETIYHTAGNIQIIIDQTMDSVDKFIEEAEDVKGQYEILGGRKIRNYKDRIKEVMEATKFYQVEEQIILRVETEKKEHKLPMTDWLVYNAFNYQLNHNKVLTAPPETKLKRDKEVFAYMLENK